jgi:hypothetical protein
MYRVAVVFLVGCLSTVAVPEQTNPPSKPQVQSAVAPTKQRLLDLLLALANGRQPLAELLDPSVGLLFMDHFEGPGEDGNTIEDLHVCPRDLAAFARARWVEVTGAIRRAQEADRLACTTAPQPTCQAGGAAEWDPVLHFTFGTRDRGPRLVLRAIAIDDEVLADPDRLAIEHANQANLLAHLANCP